MRMTLQHVSATFRKKSINQGSEADHTAKQVVLYRPEESGPASRGTMPSAGFSSDLKGLTIVNQGQLTLHYHSYNEVSSAAPQSATPSRKRTLDRVDDEEYSEALASLMDFDLSPQSRSHHTATPKRQRLAESIIEMVKLQVDKPQKTGKLGKTEKLEKIDQLEKIDELQGIDKPQKVKHEDSQPAQEQPKETDSLCKRCGNAFNSAENRASSKALCNYHPGTSKAGSLTSYFNQVRW